MTWRALLVIAAILVAAGPARAFSDPFSFSDPVQMGGGGGRFFTGSASDGYGCSVCHAGRPAAEVAITGLPLAGYRPGTAYEVRVEWPSTLEHVGLMLEITDRSGLGAGELRLPPASELPNEERCEPVEDGLAAGALIDAAPRNLLSVVDCGAKRLRFLWVAPSEARGPLRFSGGLVAADGEADSAGDGATQFARTLPEVRSAASASEIRGGCSASPRFARSDSSCGLQLLMLALVLRRMRR